MAPIYTIFTVVHGFTCPVGPYLLNKMRARYVLLLGCGTSLIGVSLSTFTTGLWSFGLTFTLTFGFGIGMCYMAVLILGWEHFPHR